MQSLWPVTAWERLIAVLLETKLWEHNEKSGGSVAPESTTSQKQWRIKKEASIILNHNNKTKVKAQIFPNVDSRPKIIHFEDNRGEVETPWIHSEHQWLFLWKVHGNVNL